jgi:hypothetical protein
MLTRHPAKIVRESSGSENVSSGIWLAAIISDRLAILGFDDQLAPEQAADCPQQDNGAAAAAMRARILIGGGSSDNRNIKFECAT